MIKASRIVQVGFNRAGTSSIADFLRRSDFKVVDHTFDGGPLKGRNLALHVQSNLKAGLMPLTGLEEWTAFTDMECVDTTQTLYGQRWFKEIAEAHPETKFILNVRDKKAWLQSRAKFGGYVQTCCTALGVSEAALFEMWSQDWDCHIAAVQQYFSSDRLLVLDIDQPDEAALNQFVGNLHSLSLRQKNKAPRGPLSKLLNQFSSPSLNRLFPQAFKNWIKNF